MQKTSSILRLLAFADQMNKYSPQNNKNDISYWRNFVDTFFTPSGVMRQTTWSLKDQSTKSYELLCSSLPRYYFLHFESGVQNMQIHFQDIIERALPGGGHYVSSEKAYWIYWLKNGHQLRMNGNLRARFDASNALELFEWVTTQHNEFIPLDQLQKSATQSPELKQSPTMSKSTGKRAQQQRQKEQEAAKKQQLQAPIPSSIVSDVGLTPAVMHCLEVCETPRLSHGKGNTDKNI